MEKEKKEKYFEAIGRRKTSTARVRILPSTKFSFIVNDIEVNKYFKTDKERKLVNDPTVLVLNSEKNIKLNITVKVSGGGMHSQAEAIRHGLSRALILMDSTSRDKLKSEGFLKRDARIKERRKFGLKKARKAPQWSKR